MMFSCLAVAWMKLQLNTLTPMLLLIMDTRVCVCEFFSLF
jgi:hypothetical protein